MNEPIKIIEWDSKGERGVERIIIIIISAAVRPLNPSVGSGLQSRGPTLYSADLLLESLESRSSSH